MLPPWLAAQLRWLLVPCLCPDRFIGNVDFQFFSGGADEPSGWRLLPLAVLQPPPVQTLNCSLPSPAWPSDHISLVCDYALLSGSAPARREQRVKRKGSAKAHL